MAQKFVINDNILILGEVEFHEDLVKDRIKSNTIGGGYWIYHKDTNTYYFYGNSIEFGQVTKEEFNSAKKEPNLQNATLIFSLVHNFIERK